MDGLRKSSGRDGVATKDVAVASQSLPEVSSPITGENGPSADDQMLRMLDYLGAMEHGRALVFEPRSGWTGRMLANAGFTGERCALLRRPLLPAAETEGAFDRVFRFNWTDHVGCAPFPGDATSHPAAPDELGAFDVIMARDALRLVPGARPGALLAWLGSLLVARGCLIVSESVPLADVEALEPTLLKRGMVMMTAYPCASDGDRSRAVAVFQRRGDEEARLAGRLERVSAGDIARDASLRTSVFSVYAEVFGGDEWREWAYCTRPGCGGTYSRADYEALSPAGYCACGWHEPLVPYHSEASVMAKLRAEVADPRRGRCYIRRPRPDMADAFVWGYIAPVDNVATLLAGKQDHGMRERLRTAMVEMLDTCEVPVPAGRPPTVYYQSEIGVASASRSMTMVRSLFHRVCQFADDTGIPVVVTRTSRTSAAHDLLLGLGMRVIGVDQKSPVANTNTYNAFVNYNSPVHVSGKRIWTQADIQAERVVFAAPVRDLLRIFYRDSDRRLALHIARHLRRGRT